MRSWLLVFVILISGCIVAPGPGPRPTDDARYKREIEYLVPRVEDRILHAELYTQILERMEQGRYKTLNDFYRVSATAVDLLRLPSLKTVGEKIETDGNYNFNPSTDLTQASRERDEVRRYVSEMIHNLKATY